MAIPSMTISLKGEIKNGQLRIDLPADLDDGLVDVELTLPEDRMPRPVISIAVECCDTSLLVSSAGSVFWRWKIGAGGVEMAHNILTYLRGNHQLLVGMPTAEHILLEIGSALPLQPDRTASIVGRNLLTGNAIRKEISSIEIRETLETHLRSLENSAKFVITPRLPSDNASPQFLPVQFRALLDQQPIQLIGEYAGLKRLDERLQAFLGIPVIREDS